MQGIRVIELGMWIAVPAAGGVLADWGADVIKVEPPAGDPMRRFFAAAAGVDVDETPPFDMDNRGKRSVVIDVRTPAGRAQIGELLADADVFLTNLRPAALTACGLAPDEVRATFPGLVYGLVTGYGRSGPDAARAGYDTGAFWSRSGLARSTTPPGEAPTNLRPGVGDHVTGMNLVAGVCAALLHRERTGEGGLVETSLLRSGVYCLSADLTMQLRWGTSTGTPDRAHTAPLVNRYECGDGQWFWLLGLESDRHWPRLVAALGSPVWALADRFATGAGRHAEAPALTSLLDAVFATAERDEWVQRFDAHDVWWAPVHDEAAVVADPQAVAAGCFAEVPAGGASAAHRAVASPVDFGGRGVEPASGVPALGEHTDEVLRPPVRA